MKGKRKLRTSFSLSAECLRLLAVLKKRFGISMSAIVEMLVREKARQENIAEWIDGEIAGQK